MQFLDAYKAGTTDALRQVLAGIQRAEEYLGRPLSRNEILHTLTNIYNGLPNKEAYGQ